MQPYSILNMIKMKTVYKEKSSDSTILFSPQLLLSAGKFNTELRVNSNSSNYISFNTAVFQRIQDGKKPIASAEGRKIHSAKITLYTILNYYHYVP